MISSKIQLTKQVATGSFKWISLISRALFDPLARTQTAEICHELGVFKIHPNLQTVTLSQLVDCNTEVGLTFATSEDWQVSAYELAAILALAKSRRIQSFFEFGTFDGRTSLNILKNLPEVRVASIDLPPSEVNLPGNKKIANLLHEHFAGRIPRFTQLSGNSVTFDFSPFRGQFDLVFIDAGHSFECALADSRSALGLIEGRDGVVIWHDYATWPGVTRAVEEVCKLNSNNADFFWIADTTLAVMRVKPGRKLVNP